MAEDATATAAVVSEGTSTENAGQAKLPTLGDSVNGLVTAMSSVFTSIATGTLSSDGTIDLTQLPAFLEKTASILKDINKTSDVTPAVEDSSESTVAQVSTEVKDETTLVFEDEWKLAISKSTGKVLGIFPDNALAQRWYSDEAEEEIASKNALSSYDSAVKRCREQVEIIIKECRRTNTKFRDPDFSLDQDSICLYSLDSSKTEYAFPPQGYAQTRKIFKKPQFYVDGATASDVKQGQAGDCWFLAGIAALTNFKACLTQNYVQVDGDEKVGVYGFVFHRDGEWIYEIVDDFLYVKNARHGHLYKSLNTSTLEWRMLGMLTEEKYTATFSEGGDALYFAQSRDENETWLPLMEKAFAKSHGDYWAIDGGHTGEAIEDLTGGITTEIRTEDILDPDVLWDELLLCNEQFIFGCWTPEWDHGSPLSEGLCSGHAYSIMKAAVVEVKGKMERLLLVRNPWGKSEWTGAFSDGSREMTAALLTKLEHETGDDGMFYMSLEDFLRKFEFIDRIRLIGNDWSCAQCWTNLKIPRTKTFLDTRYVFTMDRADQVVMSLSQLDDRYIRGLTGQYYFELEFRLEKDGSENAGHIIARSTRGINTERSVNAEIYLEAGKYNVFLKVTAHFIGGRSVKDTVTQYVESNKMKLIQIAKKYNFAHMKQGVGDKDDRIFESLTVEEEAEEKTEEKSKEDTNPTDSTDTPVTQDNDKSTDTEPKEDKSTPEPSPAPEVPVDKPVTDEPKPKTEAETKTNEEPKKEKKDKSIENWKPVATIGLRLFTRKAKVVLSVVQDTTTDASKSSDGAATKKADTTAPAGPTILVSGESEKVGNVPPIGDPLPPTPQPKASDAPAVEPASLSLNTLASPKSESFSPGTKSADATSQPSAIVAGENEAVLSSSVSNPLAMTDSSVKEGAEKAEDAKLPEEKESTHPLAAAAAAPPSTETETEPSPDSKKAVVAEPQTPEKPVVDGEKGEKVDSPGKSESESSGQEVVVTPVTGPGSLDGLADSPKNTLGDAGASTSASASAPADVSQSEDTEDKSQSAAPAAAAAAAAAT